MKGGSKPQGYTIVEVMIFLAVTAGLFVAVAATFSGQQGKTQFSTAVREMDSRLQDIINDVSTGYYANSGNVRCSESGGVPNISTGGSNTQGTSEDCIFIGRVVHFNVAGGSGQQYKVYTAVGLRQTGPLTSRTEVQDFNEAKPRSSPLLVSTDDLPNGLSVARVSYSGIPGGDIDGVGFFSSFGSRNAATGQLEPGSLSVNLLPLGDAGSSTEGDMINDIRLITNASTTNPSGGVTICVNSGTSDQHATFVIGGNERRLSTDVSIGSGTC